MQDALLRRCSHLCLSSSREHRRPFRKPGSERYRGTKCRPPVPAERKKFLAQLSADDHKYFSFQLWQEGIARYTQIKVAEAAASYQPTEEYKALGDFESFVDYSARARQETLDELRRADLAKTKRVVFYSFGATEGLLLDRLNARWKEKYFQQMFSTDSYFESR